MRSASFIISARPNSSIVRHNTKRGMVYHVFNKLRIGEELAEETVRELQNRRFTEKEYISCSNFIDAVFNKKTKQNDQNIGYSHGCSNSTGRMAKQLGHSGFHKKFVHKRLEESKR